MFKNPKPFAAVFFTALIGMIVLPTADTALAAGPIVVDHNCTDLSKVPASYVTQAKSLFRMSYGHTSHGSQVISGMDVIKGAAGSLYWYDREGTSGGLSVYDYTPDGDLGNPDRTTWAARTRTMLNATGNTRNLVMWSWCGQADASAAEIQTYLDLMSQLRADYPNVTFIYMTGHLVGSGEAGNLNQRNNQIRAHVRATNGILFDFADIESYDPNGNYFLNLGADDGCNYWLNGVQHNWATEWCAAHPGQCSSCSCAHSQSLNCDRKGRAFWWMMARLAGWAGVTTTVPADFDADGDVDLTDFTYFQGCFNGPNRPIATGCGNADFDGDQDVDLSDFTVFQTCFNGPSRPPNC